jgi:hypothetical protein
VLADQIIHTYLLAHLFRHIDFILSFIYLFIFF